MTHHTPTHASAKAIAHYAQGITEHTCRPEDIPVQDREAVQEELLRRYVIRKAIQRTEAMLARIADS